jgi:hypothetical protein
MSLPERYRQLRKEGKLPKQAWEQLKSEYTKQFRKRKRKQSGDAEQSWKSASGKAFESIVWQEFTSQCQGLQDLRVARWHDIPDSLKEPLSERLWVRGEIQAVRDRRAIVGHRVSYILWKLSRANRTRQT